MQAWNTREVLPYPPDEGGPQASKLELYEAFLAIDDSNVDDIVSMSDGG